MYEAENKVMNTEDELINVLLDFIIVSANLAKNISRTMKQRQIKEGGSDNGKSY